MAKTPSLPPVYYDAHNHLQDAWLTPHRTQVFAEMAAVGVIRAVANGTHEGDWSDVTQLAQAHPWILPSYGLHPWQVGNAGPAWRDRLAALVEANPHAAIGEIGLDRWILERARSDDSRLQGLRRASLPEQIECFRWQLELAASYNRPVTIHCLDAWGPLRELLVSSPKPARGFLLHAYGGSAELARELTAAGAYFSFNGAFLHDRQSAKRTVFESLPAERLLVETDAPAMSLPAERRTHHLPNLAGGTSVNHPANLAATYTGLAAIRATSLENLTTVVAENFARYFGGEART